MGFASSQNGHREELTCGGHDIAISAGASTKDTGITISELSPMIFDGKPYGFKIGLWNSFGDTIHNNTIYVICMKAD